MVFGREREIRKLHLNIQRGIHTLVFGAPGAGKTVLLMEAASRLSTDRIGVVYVNNCRSRRNLLEGALRNLGGNGVLYRGMSVKDLRNALLEACDSRRLCLVLDHVPIKLYHRLQRLLEILEAHCTLVWGVTAFPGSYDLYYWKFDVLEVDNLSRKSSLAWIDAQLRSMNYAGTLKKAIAHELFRLTGGNPGAISRTLGAISKQAMPLDDPIRLRRMFVDGLTSRNTI